MGRILSKSPQTANINSLAEFKYKLADLPISSFTIPASVTSIGASTFSACGLVTKITVLATTPPTLGNNDSLPRNLTVIEIPHGSLAAYQSAQYWSNHSSKFVELPE